MSRSLDTLLRPSLLAIAIALCTPLASKLGRNKVSSERDIQRLLKVNTSQLPRCRTRFEK